MQRGVAFFFARLFTTKNKDLFAVRLGTTLLLNSFGVVGPLASVIGFGLRCLIGLLIEDATFLIDISIDSYKEGAKLKEFEAEAKKAYELASKGVHSEEKKNEIRKQYLDIISRVGSVGGVR